MIVVVDTTRVLTEAQYVLLVNTRDLLRGEHVRVAEDHTAVWFDHYDEGDTFLRTITRSGIVAHQEQ